MVYVVALVIFLAAAAAQWAVSAALYQRALAAPDPAAGHDATPGLAIAAIAATSFIPFPAGYVVGLVVWAVAVFAGLGLPAGRAAVLWLFLAVTSFATRLVLLGVLGFVGK